MSYYPAKKRFKVNFEGMEPSRSDVAKQPPKYLLVEGKNDVKFFKGKKLLRENIECWIIIPPNKRYHGNAQKFYEDSRGYENSGEGNKTTLLDELRYHKLYPHIDPFGMIDKDFDDPNDQKFDDIRHKLFITDTHDLDTLLLKTDDVLYKLKISSERKLNAYYLAYQIGLLKKYILPYLTKVLGKNYDTDFDAFTDTFKVSLDKFLDYAFEKEKILNNRDNIKFKIKHYEAITTFFQPINPVITDEYVFCKSLPNTLYLPDFWDVVNGHDIVKILKYKFKDISERYPEKNTRFEQDIIEKYHKLKFVNTKIYDAMLDKKIVKEISLEEEIE